MGSDTAIVVKYWISTDSEFQDLDGIAEFRNDLATEYVSVVKGRPTGAGGAVRLLVDLISHFPLSHVLQLLIDGVAYDLIKEGSRSFILRPFIAAYKKLRERNIERPLDIEELKIEFADCQLVVHEILTGTVIANLENILLTLSAHYAKLIRANGELPFEIHIPVIEDPDEKRKSRFRVLADFDETITGVIPDDYFRYWGVVYGRIWERCVYDVREDNLLNESFMTVPEFWRDFEGREREDNSREN